MGWFGSSAPKTVPAAAAAAEGAADDKPKCKICCACPDTKVRGCWGWLYSQDQRLAGCTAMQANMACGLVPAALCDHITELTHLIHPPSSILSICDHAEAER